MKINYSVKQPSDSDSNTWKIGDYVVFRDPSELHVLDRRLIDTYNLNLKKIYQIQDIWNWSDGLQAVNIGLECNFLSSSLRKL